MRGDISASPDQGPTTDMPILPPVFRPRALCLALLAALAAVPALADPALGGVDVVSLRDAGRVAKGGDITTHWQGREWHFSSEANRATFESDPRSYAPGFGGNCPVALSQGERRPGRPELFVVIGNTLYLTSSPVARRKLSDDPADVLARAAAQWKRMRR